jgi:hypothetical protein
VILSLSCLIQRYSRVGSQLACEQEPQIESLLLGLENRDVQYRDLPGSTLERLPVTDSGGKSGRVLRGVLSGRGETRQVLWHGDINA